MARIIYSNALTFDDILLVPQFSTIASRKHVDISTSLFGVSFETPICSANMDTITEPKMAIAMHSVGGVGFLHRYASTDTIKNWIKDLHRVDPTMPIVPSIGIKSEEVQNAVSYIELGATAINIDIAHGDSASMIRMIEQLQNLGIKIIAGNVATKDAALRLAEAGADVIKVGIGGGSMCTTRIVTGHGVPQLCAIEECAKVKGWFPDVKIIADGGIRNSGDCVKALAFGADMCMIGSLLAGTTQTPGTAISSALPFKVYRGMASAEARSSVADVDESYVPEGVTTNVPIGGSATHVVKQLAGGIRSGFSYSGAANLAEFQEKAEYVVVTNSGLIESRPHGLNLI